MLERAIAEHLDFAFETTLGGATIARMVYDNTAPADPRRGVAPEPFLLLHTVRGKVRSHAQLDAVPDWAKAIVAAALQPH